MKKFILCLCLISSLFALNAQSIRSDMDYQGTDMDYVDAFYKFYGKEIPYNAAHEKYLSAYFNWLFKTQFIYNINRIVGTSDFSNGPEIEIEKNGNIYTYPVAFTNAKYRGQPGSIAKDPEVRRQMYDSYDNSDIITFYNTNLNVSNSSATFVNIHGANYNAVHAGMNKIKIGSNVEDISTCFSGINTDGTLEVLTPRQYLRNDNLGSDKVILTIDATYSGKPSIIYTKPLWMVIGGQLLEIDNGIHYEVPLHNASFLTIVNTSTMKSEVIALEGIYNMYMKHNRDTHKIFIYNGGQYGQNSGARTKSGTMSMNQSPIYVAEINENGEFTVLASIIPQEGDVITNIQQSNCGKYIVMCGTNRNRGYVGYDNAMFIVYDSTTFEELGRYRGKRKDRYFKELTCIDEDNMYVKYDDWDSSFYGPYERSSKNFEIINISSVIEDAQ